MPVRSWRKSVAEVSLRRHLSCHKNRLSIGRPPLLFGFNIENSEMKECACRCMAMT